jgi:hypothetical protein
MEWSLIDLSDERAGYVAAMAIRSRRKLAVARLAMPTVEQNTTTEMEER